MAEEIRITLRLPKHLHSVVKTAAGVNNRSMNEEIVESLSAHYSVTDELRMRIEKIEKILDDLVLK